MTEYSLSNIDRDIGIGELIGVFEELDMAIEKIRHDDNVPYVIYEMKINKVYNDVNEIFKCVWRQKMN